MTDCASWKRQFLRAPLPVMAFIVGASFFTGCRDDAKVSVAESLGNRKLPTMVTTNVSTLISDSGITQYKIVSPVWYVYDETDTPCWTFPKGLYLRKYDRQFRVIASVAADSARYYRQQKLWKLDGNVELTKAPADIFLTQQLFWDERNGQLYSDSFIHIETQSHTLEGYGFSANDRLTQYSINRPTGIFPADTRKLTAK